MPTLEPLPYHKRGINGRRKMFIDMLTDNLAHTISYNSCLVYARKSWFVGDPLASKFTRKKSHKGDEHDSTILRTSEKQNRILYQRT